MLMWAAEAFPASSLQESKKRCNMFCLLHGYYTINVLYVYSLYIDAVFNLAERDSPY